MAASPAIPSRAVRGSNGADRGWIMRQLLDAAAAGLRAQDGREK
jgi:hypothetical protein